MSESDKSDHILYETMSGDSNNHTYDEIADIFKYTYSGSEK